MRKFETPFCIVLLWTFLMLNYCAFIAEGVDGESSLSLSDAAVKIREQVDIRNMRKDIARLSSLSTRVTGYPEAANASKYIFDRFTEIGLQNVEGRDFEITVPIDHGDGRLEVLNSNGEPTLVFQISPIWPNLIRTSLLPPNGLRVPIFYAGSSDLQDFNNKDIGGFWYEVKEGDTLESVANRFHVGVGAITDDILNDSLQKTDDGVDNNEDLQIDEYGEIPLLSDISIWAKDRIDNNGNGIIDEIPGDNTDGKDNDKNGQIDEKGEFIAASESSIFIPEGSVVLVDFNSSTRWINAAMLGAKAVVFIEPETTNRGEAENKFLTVPANIPRFWINKANAEKIKAMIVTAESKNEKVSVRLKSTMTWERRTGQNIRGYLEGGDLQLKDEMVVINAYYDSMSVVPAIAPGADPTSGIASMLELARIFSEKQFRPGRSVLFVATDAHFQGLAGMRAFMEGIGKDVVGRDVDSPGTPTMYGLRRGLSNDKLEFEELGRKILISIDRNVLVDLPPDFYHDVHQVTADLKSLDITLADLSVSVSNVNSLRDKQRDFQIRQKKKILSRKKREKQDFTAEEKSLLDVNLSKIKKDSQQTTQFLRDIVQRIDRLRERALTESRAAQRELLESIALPMARIDVWAIKELEADLKSENPEKFSQVPGDAYIDLQEEDGDYSLKIPPELRGQPLEKDIQKLSNSLRNWELKDERKLLLRYAPEKLLDRHLNYSDLKKLIEARRIISSAEASLSSYISQEKQILGNIRDKITGSDSHKDFFVESISKLNENPLLFPEKAKLALYISDTDLLNLSSYQQKELGDRLSRSKKGNLDRFEELDKEIKQKQALLSSAKADRTIGILLETLKKDKQNILESGLRNARIEAQRIDQLLNLHANLNRGYLDEEILVLKHYLQDHEKIEQAIRIRTKIAAHLTEQNLLAVVKERAESDIVDLQNLLGRLDQLNSGLKEETKSLLRDNMLTLRNARFRNIQSRVEKIARISKSEYQRKIAALEQAIALQDLFNRYYASLFISVDLSTQNDTFGVFNKGWFYDQQPEHVLRREFASIGNKLSEYADDADFGERIEQLWKFTNDQIQQSVMTSQWGISAGIAPKEAIEGKTLETLIGEHFSTLQGLGGVSRLMKMQFQQMRDRGEPSEDMLKDIDYIRKEVERFIRNDIRSSRKARKGKIRQLNKLNAQLTLRNEDPSEFTQDEIDDIKELINVVGLGGSSNFINGISASGGKTWKTYIPGKIAFDSEVATLAGKTGIAFATIDDARMMTDTPFDAINRMDINKNGNLHKQVKTMASILIQALRDPLMPTSAKVGNFYCNLYGDVVEYDARESALPSKAVPEPIITLRRKHKTMAGVRGDLIIQGDNKGLFEVVGLAMEGRATNRMGGAQEVEPYVLDRNSGDIVYAPDLGNYGAKVYNNKVPIDRRQRGCRIVVFPCVSTTIYDLVDQRSLRTLRELQIYDAATDSFPEKYGLSKPIQQQGVSATEPIALVYSEPDKRIKIGMSYGQIGKRLLLIKAGRSGAQNPTLYTGEGFVVSENGSIRVTPYVVIRDMWWLDENRNRLYKKFGISSDRLDQLHQFANERLVQARDTLLKRDYSQALKLARAAWGFESRAYPDVKKTGNDVVSGVMFYLALLLPFAYFMERLLFGFASIWKQITGTFSIFLVVFFFLAQVHPAFQITATPIIILVAFIVLTLSVLVVAIIIRKFEEQLELMKQQASKVYKADVGRLAASAAAFSLGISNMRKRGMRTTLTCVTLVILTFTVISFTSVRTFMRPNSTTLAAVTPKYTGMLIRDQYWRAMEEPVVTTITNDLRKKEVSQEELERLFRRKGKPINSELSDVTIYNVVAPRAWYQTSGTGDQSFVQLTRTANKSDPRPKTTPTGKPKTFAANMLVGMSKNEPEVTGIHSHLKYGAWFKPENESEWPTKWPYACVLPQGMADLLGIEEADMGKATVSVYGENFTVTGVLGVGFKDLKDNDGEELTPVDYQLMNQQSSRGGQGEETLEGELQKYLHLTPDSIAILPYEVVMNQGGNLKSVAVSMEVHDQDTRKDNKVLLNAEDKLDLIMAPLMTRISLDFFVGRGKDAYLYSAIGMTSFSGMGNLFIPILIASLIVLNTMLGAVYERVREIGIYSSVGLAPIHIAFLFLAEACVYAIVGAVFGYLFGQAVATILVKFNLLAGLTLNYSSMSTVMATIIVMLVVIGSTLYPAIKAGRMAVPDIERKWKLPEPDGDFWQFSLPFTVLSEESLGLNIFMRDYFEAHSDESASDFYSDQITFNRTIEGEEDTFSIGMMVWLAPYDLGVSQKVALVTVPIGGEEEGLYRIGLNVTRESGEIASWKRVNRRFLNLVRKQLLIWRTFSHEVRGEFHNRGRQESSSEREVPAADLTHQPAD